MLYSHHHDQLYKYTCRNITIQWRRATQYLKGLCVWEGSWRPNRTAIYWPPLLWPSALCLSCSPDAQPEARGPSFLLSAGFLYHILSPTGLVSKLTDFLSSPNYIIVRSPTQYLWNGMFDRSSSSGNNCHAVYRSLYLVPYCQPSPPTRFLPITAIGMCHFLPVHHFGITCLAESKVNIQH